MATYCSGDDPYLVTLDTNAVVRQRAVRSATNRINSALAASPQGYVVPVVSTDENIVARLESLCLDIAAYELSRGHAGTGQKVAKDFADAMAYLAGLRDGSQEFIGLPIAGTGAKTYNVAGKRLKDFDNAIWISQDNMLVPFS